MRVWFVAVLSSHDGRIGRAGLILISLCAMSVGAGLIVFAPWLIERRRSRRWREGSLIGFSCPHCQKPILVDEHFAGTKARCRHCRETLVVPTESSEVTFAGAIQHSRVGRATQTVANAVRLDGPQMNSFLSRLAVAMGFLTTAAGIAMFLYIGYGLMFEG